MLSTLDRYVLRSLVINYVLGLGTMLSLYVALDMFVNMDEFTEHGYPFGTVLRNIASYYWPNLFVYFKQLSGAITLFACAATLARMRKLNELTAVLASGVSLHRVAAPVLGFALATSVLLVVDTEVLIPAVAHRLARDHDDIDGRRAYEVPFLRDADGSLLSAAKFDPIEQDLQGLLVLYRDAQGDIAATLEADRAYWEPFDDPEGGGRWRLVRGQLITRTTGPRSGLGPSSGQVVTERLYYESDLSPKIIELRQSEGWVRFLSLAQLRDLQKTGAAGAAAIAQTRHGRQTAPMVSLVLVLLGVPFFLNRMPAQVLSDATRCVGLCGLCYVVTIMGQTLRTESVSPLPAWIPIFVFGTWAVVLIDRIRT